MIAGGGQGHASQLVKSGEDGWMDGCRHGLGWLLCYCSPSLWDWEVSLATWLGEIVVLCFGFCGHSLSSKYTEVEGTINDKICKIINIHSSTSQQCTVVWQEGPPRWGIYGPTLLLREDCVVPGMQDSLAPFFTSLWLCVLDATSWGVASQLPLAPRIMEQEGGMVPYNQCRRHILGM